MIQIVSSYSSLGSFLVSIATSSSVSVYLQINIIANPTPNTISIWIVLRLSASAIISTQYIKVKYNSIPLITSENVFITLFVCVFVVNIQVKISVYSRLPHTFLISYESLHSNLYLFISIYIDISYNRDYFIGICH